MALRGRRHWLAIDGLGGPSYKTSDCDRLRYIKSRGCEYPLHRLSLSLFQTGCMSLPQIGLSQGRHLPQGRLGVTAGVEQPAVRKLVRFAIAELFPEYAVHVVLR